MITTTGARSSSNADYALQLAQSSKLERSLFNFGTAIQNGNLSSARSILTALIKAYPEYAASPDDSAKARDPIDEDFQAVAEALDKDDAGAAKAAWAQLKSDLAKAGLSKITDGKAATAKLLAETKASINQAIIGNMFGFGSNKSSLAATLFGDSSSSGSSDSVITALVNWLSYKADGKTSVADGKTTGGTLDTKA
jgi:hypothetical protein